MNKPVFVLLVLIIPVIVYLLSFSSIIYNKQFIEKQMGESGLLFHAKKINSFVIDYLMEKDETELLQMEVFSDEEKQHLLDVKILIHRVFDFLFLMLVLFFILIYFNCKINKNKNLYRILIYSGIITVAVPLIMYLVPFETFFTAFHQIFFAQGSWVFPAGSALVQLYPPDFWYRASFSLFLRGFVTGWLLILLGFIVGKK